MHVYIKRLDGGGGWESNPPHADNDASLVLKTREATRLQSPPFAMDIVSATNIKPDP